MKILCIADIHGFLDGLGDVKDYVGKNNINTIFLLGDYSAGFEDLARNRRETEQILDELSEASMVYAIPGNCDDPKVIGIFERKNANMHERVIVLDNVSFIGLGGSNSTPFGTPIEMDEDYIFKKLSGMLDEAKTERKVLVTHFPPKDTECDNIPGVGHVGSPSLRRVIEENRPDLCVCSHIHEGAGKSDAIGKTRIINVGPLASGNLAVLDTLDLSASQEIL
jgi:Icc-related predicted phosphoesterase